MFRNSGEKVVQLVKNLFEAPTPRTKLFDLLGFATYLQYYALVYVVFCLFPCFGNTGGFTHLVGRTPLSHMTSDETIAFITIAVSALSIFGLSFYHFSLTMQFRSPKFQKYHVEEVDDGDGDKVANIHWLLNYKVASIIATFFLVRAIGYLITDSYCGIIFSGTGTEAFGFATGILAFSFLFVVSMFFDMGKFLRPRNGLLFLAAVLLAETIMRFC